VLALGGRRRTPKDWSARVRAPILVVTFSHSKTACSPASFALERLFFFLFFLYQLSFLIQVPLTLQVEPWRADATLCDRACRGTMQWAFETRGKLTFFLSFFFSSRLKSASGVSVPIFFFFFPFNGTLLPLAKALCLLVLVDLLLEW